MLIINDYKNNNSIRTLNHSDDVFHEALKYVKQGETEFNVIKNEDTKYSLSYVNNNEYCFNDPNFPPIPLFKGKEMYPPYLEYDENNIDKLCLDYIKNYNSLIFEQVDEYSVVLTKVVLKTTSNDIYFTDDKIYWFINPNDRIHIISSIDEKIDNAIKVYKSFNDAAIREDYSISFQIFLFHNVFLFNYLTKLDLKDCKYIEINVPPTEGIGSLIYSFEGYKIAFEKYGLTAILKNNNSRYSDEILTQYFDIIINPKDSNKDNTIYMNEFFACFLLYIVKTNTKIDYSFIQKKVLNEMKQYEEALFNNKKILGVLIRGTDYITNNMTSVRKPLSVETIVPIIKKIFENGKYDKIFLATEDIEILNKMKDIFKNNLIAVAQERYSVKQIEKYTFISEYEKANQIGNEKTKDMVANYLYAIYLLSKAQGFISIPECSAYKIIRLLNKRKKKKFEYSGCITIENIEKLYKELGLEKN